MSGALPAESFTSKPRNNHTSSVANTMADEYQYSRQHDSNHTPPGGIPGVKYSQPFVPQYASYSGYTNTAPGSTQGPQPSRAPPPTGSFQYSQLPHGIQYSAKPVIPVAKFEERSSKKKKKKDTYDDLEKYRSRSPEKDDDDDKHYSKSRTYDDLDKYRSRGNLDDDDDDNRSSRKNTYDDLDKYRSRDLDSDEDRRTSKKSNYDNMDKYRSRGLDSDDEKSSILKGRKHDNGSSYLNRSQESDDEEHERLRKIYGSKSKDSEYGYDDRRPTKKDDKYDDLDYYRSRDPEFENQDRYLDRNRQSNSSKSHRPDSPDSDRDSHYPYNARSSEHSKSFSSNAPYPTDRDASGRDDFLASMPPPPPPPPGYRDTDSRSRSYGGEPGYGNTSYRNGQRINEIEPRDRSPSPPGRGMPKSKHLSISDDRSGLRAPSSGGLRAPSPSGLRGPSPSGRRGPSPAGLRSGMDRLSVGGERSETRSMGGGMPPPSPLLEAYRGTWQSMPVMPSPMANPRDFDDEDLDDIDDLEPLDPRRSNSSFQLDGRKSGVSLYKKSSNTRRDSDSSISPNDESHNRKDSSKRKSVSMYAADQDAKDIAKQLLSRGEPKFSVITGILPHLSHDQILELHTAYKRVAKLNGKGINLAKHIKLKAKGNYGTIAYVTALGRWESEGYWANYWYQSSSSNRELLIESLMGRPNREIHMIKESFRDKRYGDDLQRCMEKELRADKFRTAVLLTLDERRQEEKDIWPKEYVEKDVDVWVKAMRRGGGESAMLEICVVRSDKHLRECLKLYEKREGSNFAKVILERSQNLVGEVIVHILNGVINRPARDAMLLHHALIDLKKKPRRESTSSKDDTPRSSKTSLKEAAREKQKEAQDRKERYELLASRLVRLHWDRPHLRRVKEEYRIKYDAPVEHDVEDYVKEGEFKEFCFGLLSTK